MYRENGIVYYYSPETDSFQILYNFKAQKGSTWINIFGIGYQVNPEAFIDTVQVTVDSVTTININETRLKKFHITYQSLNKAEPDWTYRGITIEKIGDPYFLFPFEAAGLFCETAYKGLKCYEDPELGFVCFNTDSCNTEEWTSLLK